MSATNNVVTSGLTRPTASSSPFVARFPTRLWTSVLLLLVVASACGDHHRDSHATAPCCATCGDGVCGGDENACNCPVDCGTAQLCAQLLPTCGNGVCESGVGNGERHENCSADCPLTCVACESRSHIYFMGTAFPDSHKCPDGTTHAQSVGNLIICDTCESSSGCPDELKPACLAHCVPNCTLDTGECCPVKDCSLD